VEIKFQLDATDDFLLQIVLLAEQCFGHHYAHHQELESIIQVVAACGIWCFGFQVVGMVWS
jgi:fumarate reductase subunit D